MIEVVADRRGQIELQRLRRRELLKISLRQVLLVGVVKRHLVANRSEGASLKVLFECRKRVRRVGRQLRQQRGRDGGIVQHASPEQLPRFVQLADKQPYE